MKIVDKLRMSVCRTSDQVILRSELNKFGSQSQLSAAINMLIDDGVIMRVGRPGVFVKIKKSSQGRSELLCDDIEVVLKEFFRKINVRPEIVKTECHKNRHEYLVESTGSRKSGEFHFGDGVVVYVQAKHRCVDKYEHMPEDVEKLPKRNVTKFIQDFAAAHHVEARRSKLDLWAEAVTRAAGDSVRLDDTGQLLKSLYKSKLINAQQMARLMTNHMLELRSKKKSKDHRDMSGGPVSSHSDEMVTC